MKLFKKIFKGKERPVEDLYVSPYANWKAEHREWMHAHSLKPLTFE